MRVTTEQRVGGVDMCPLPLVDGGKVNLKLVARQYETSGFPGPATREELRERYRGNFDQRAIDLYALGVPVIGGVVGLAVAKRSERGPHGLVQEAHLSHRPVQYFVSGDPYSQLRENMTSTLGLATDEYLDLGNLEATFASNPHARRNHEVFTILAEDHVGSIEGFVRQGIDTSSNIMPATLQLIPVLYRKQFHSLPDASAATQIARDNYPFLSRMAIMHLVPFIDFTENTIGGRKKKPLDLEKFEFQQTNKNVSGLELQYTKKTQDELRMIIDRVFTDPHFRLRLRLGCIAAHSDALRSLWDWQVDIAEQTIYPQQLRLYDFAQLNILRVPGTPFKG